jgi:hypothetical protein
MFELDEDDDELGICGCGVTGPTNERGECPTCARAPHERECGCDDCAAYWEPLCD